MLQSAMCEALFEEFHMHRVVKFSNKTGKPMFISSLTLKLTNVRLLAQDNHVGKWWPQDSNSGHCIMEALCLPETHCDLQPRGRSS